MHKHIGEKEKKQPKLYKKKMYELKKKKSS